jgi:uncharacterized membrane protein
MEMLIEVVAAVLLLAGSGLVFYALLSLEREPAPVVRTAIRRAPVPSTRKLPRAA